MPPKGLPWQEQRTEPFEGVSTFCLRLLQNSGQPINQSINEREMSAPWNNRDRDRDRDRSRDERRSAGGSRWNAVTSSWSKTEVDKQVSRWQSNDDNWTNDIDNQLERFQSDQSNQWSNDKKGAWSKESGGWVTTKTDERDWKTSTYSSRSGDAPHRGQAASSSGAASSSNYEADLRTPWPHPKHSSDTATNVVQPKVVPKVHPLHPRKRL